MRDGDGDKIVCDRPGCGKIVDDLGLFSVSLQIDDLDADDYLVELSSSEPWAGGARLPDLCTACAGDMRAWWTEVIRSRDTRTSLGKTMAACADCSDHHCRWCGLPMVQSGCAAWRCTHVRHGARLRVRAIVARISGRKARET